MISNILTRANIRLLTKLASEDNITPNELMKKLLDREYYRQLNEQSKIDFDEWSNEK